MATIDVQLTHEEPDVTHTDLRWPIRRVRADSVEQIDERVVLEEPLEIVVNDQSIAVLMRMPGHEKELAVGFCISEGYVRRIRDVLLIHHCGSGHPAPDDLGQDPAGSRNRVQLRVAAGGFSPPDHPEVVRLIRSGCGAAEVSALSEILPQVTQPYAVSRSVLLELSQAMRTQQDVHNQVGGTHSAALFDAAGQVTVVCEDIGRHNAVDKAIGSCLLWDIPLNDQVLVTSGRASYEMVVKAIRVGIPVVATISAPTSLAVQLAETQGLTLIGYLRGGRMNVYTHAKRVSLG